MALHKGFYFRVLQLKCLLKCSYFKKPPQGPLPWKIPGYVPDVNQRSINPANIYLLKVNNRNRRECDWRYCGVFIANFEHVSHLSLVFLLLILNM